MKVEVRKLRSAIFLFIFALVLAGIMTFAGYVTKQTAQQTAEYPTAEATIYSIHVEYDIDGDIESTNVIVEYEIDGTTHQAKLNYYSSSMQEGQTVTIKYNPSNPESMVYNVGDNSGSVITIIKIVAYILVVLALVNLVSKIMKLAKRNGQDKAISEGTAADDANGIDYYTVEETKLYHYPLNQGFKPSFVIEDENRNVVFQTAFLKARGLIAADCEFKNLATGETTTHKIGVPVTETTGSGFMATSITTFRIDGKDVWEYLHDLGIRFNNNPQLTNLTIGYEVTCYGKPFATITRCGRMVHEEDAGTGLIANAAGFPGCFRIVSHTTNMELLAIILYTLSNSENILMD